MFEIFNSHNSIKISENLPDLHTWFNAGYISPKSYMKKNKIKSAKIKWYLRFSIAIIRSKLKKNHQISLHGSMLAMYCQKAI
jgi:hypothetical protein